MANCRPFGVFAYSIKDIHPPGFIPRKISRVLAEFEEPTEEDLKNTDPGQSFEKIPDPYYPDEIDWIETNTHLPSSILAIEFQFRSRTQSKAKSIGGAGGPGGGFGLLGAGAGSLGTTIANQTFQGGTSKVRNQMSFHICEAESRFDVPMTITEEVLRTGKIRIPNHALSIVGIFKDPLDLPDYVRDRIGSEETNSVNGLEGPVDGNLQFEGQIIDGFKDRINDEEQIVALFIPEEDDDRTPREIFEEKNIFEGIIKDDRVLRFRADAPERFRIDQYAPNHHRYAYDIIPFGINDITNDTAEINTEGLEEGDIVYVTACFVSQRDIRQLIQHDASFTQTNSRVGIGGVDVLPTSTEIQAWNYQIAEWRVPKDLDRHRVNLDVFEESLDDEDRDWEIIEAWRLSELIKANDFRFFAADSRGIVLIDKSMSGSGNKVIIPRSQIDDTNGWFEALLANNNLTGSNFDDVILGNDDHPFLFGHLFDISSHVNSILTDNEKVPYWAPLAKALSSSVDLEPPDFLYSGVRSDFTADQSHFVQSTMSSRRPSAYQQTTCTGGSGGFGGFFDPTDPANSWTMTVQSPPGDLQSDWLIRTPFFNDFYNTNSRIYIESMRPAGANSTHSQAFVITSPVIGGSISAQTFPKTTEGFVFFESNESKSLAFYHFKDGNIKDQFQRLTPVDSTSHEVGDFDHDAFKVLGYNIALGDSPSYNRGEVISDEVTHLCFGNGENGSVSPEDIYSKAVLFGDEDDEEYSSLISESPFEINDVSSDDLMYNITFVYRIEQDLDSSVDASISLEFGNSEYVINNINFPLTQGVHEITVDARFYRGSLLRIHGEAIKNVQWKSIYVWKTTENDISPYLVRGSEVATSIDQRGSIFVFFADFESDNISVTRSHDNGRNWQTFKDIIRLIRGERASSPHVIKSTKSNLIYLFYILNERFLMVKPIDPDLLNCDDLFISYEPPDKFDAYSHPLLGLENYSDFGQKLRIGPSYFVHGDHKDDFFSKQIEISNERLNKYDEKRRNQDDDEDGPVLAQRFLFQGNVEQVMDESFEGSDYSIIHDNKGGYKLFISNGEGKVHLKHSGNLINWVYYIKNAIVHREFSDDEEGKDIGSIRAVYNNKEDLIYLLYFFNQALYMRIFSGADLYPKNATDVDLVEDSESGTLAIEEKLAKYFNVNKDSSERTLPIFVVGELPANVYDVLQENSTDSRTSDDLLVRFRNTTGNIEKFGPDENAFPVDINTKPDGYMTKNGLLRLFYRAQTGGVYGATINGDTITLDAQLRYQENQE